MRDQPDLAPTAVLGANARDGDSARMRLLERLDYRRVFEMVEMELHDRPASHSRRPGIATRTVTSQDAEAIAELTARVWTGVVFFVCCKLRRCVDVLLMLTTSCSSLPRNSARWSA